MVFGQGAGDQAEGPLGLPVGEQVRAGLPVLEHAEPHLVRPGQGDSASRTRVRCAGRWPAWDSMIPASRVRTRSWRCRTPTGSSASARGATPQEGVDDLLQRGQRDAHPVPPSSLAWPQAGSSVASRSPSRWEQVIPAACMNVASRAVPRPRPARWRGKGRLMLQQGQPGPAGQQPGQRGGDVPAAGIGSAADRRGPGKACRGQQPLVVAGQDRPTQGPGAAHGNYHPAGPAGDIGAAHGAQVGADQPGAGTRQTSAPACIRRDAAGCASASARYPAISAAL